MTATPAGFPPQDLRRFLELCAGEWLALRSHFDLSLVAEDTPADAATAAVHADPEIEKAAEPPAATVSTQDAEADALPDFAALLLQARAEVEEAPIEEAWHSSERGELLVAFLASAQVDQPGGLRVTPPQGDSRELHFRADGDFAAAPDAPPEGTWRLWPDGSLELTVETSGRVLRERIWFTQPNLRLRSSVEHGTDGRPGRARFSSEIRRVRKPAA